MITVGLTGGIGSGKSEVARLLAALGAVVIDSDRLAREAVAPGSEGLARVVEEFGPEVLAADGSLDRPALARVVFADPERLQALNAIVHPYVGRLSRRLAAQAPPDAVVVHDVPLLVENRLQAHYDVVVVVDASTDAQLRRLVENRGMTEAEVRARMAAQAGREERRAAADIVITNDAGLDDLAAQVNALWDELVARHRRRHRHPS